MFFVISLTSLAKKSKPDNEYSSKVVWGKLQQGRGWTGSGGARSDSSDIGGRMCSNMVAPVRREPCDDMGAPVMLLDHAGLLMSG